jgi:hypothetical protein
MKESSTIIDVLLVLFCVLMIGALTMMNYKR